MFSTMEEMAAKSGRRQVAAATVCFASIRLKVEHFSDRRLIL